MKFAILFLCFITISFGKILNLTLGTEMDYLNPSQHPGCVTQCDSYHAGADINSTLVCTYQASGVGTLKQNVELGTACYPSYNCREDWNICIQWKLTDNKSPIGIPKDNPYHNLSNETALYNACSEITGLISGGNSGTKPPLGGWKPTSLGWRKGSGNIGCGWGSTFSSVERNSPYTLEDFGRIVINDFSGTEVDCCVESMKYEATDIKHGGAAIRFDLYNGACRIDRELMMRGNLDSSGGRPLNKLDHCGNDGIDFFYWRSAAGAADAANLQSSGICALRHNFTRVSPENAITPTGRLPDGSEIPNRLPECEGSQPQMCLESLRYNSINTVEGCCEVCTELRWLPSDGENNPCVAFQIVDGKCRILRKKWFDVRYGEDNLGNNPSGNNKMTITETINACAGFNDHSKCSRRDNSHGYWGTCSSATDASVGNDCSYFSHMRFRDPEYTNFSIIHNNINDTYRKIKTLKLTNENGTVIGINISANTSIVTDRTTKRITLTNAPIVNIPDGSKPTDTNSKGYGHDAPKVEPTICSRIALYIKDPGLMHYDAHTHMDVFNPNMVIPAIYTSNYCCNLHPQRYISPGTKTYCEMKMNITTEFIQSVVELRQSRESNQRSRRLIETVPEFIIAYECVGGGKDLCDVNPNYEIPNAIVSNAEFVNQSTINNTTQQVVLINSDSPSPSSSTIILNNVIPSPSTAIIQEKNVNDSPSPLINDKPEVVFYGSSENKSNTKIAIIILIYIIITLSYI